MTLEDFFTLTEMKDGFIAPARVEELIAVIQKQKDSSVNNVGDATRQWAAVASTIAATENRECLDLFIQLDGLYFIDRWLKDAQTFSIDASDCFVEEATSSLLQAVEKLLLNTEKLASSGICITVESLLSYKSARVQDKVRALFDCWKAKDVDCNSMDVQQTPVDNDPKLENQDPESNVLVNNASTTRYFSDEKLECADRGKDELSDDQASCQIASKHADINDGCPKMVALPAKVESIEGDRVKEDVCPSEGLDSKCITDAKQGTNGTVFNASKCESVAGDAKYDNKFDMLSDTSGVNVTSSCAGKDMSSRTDAMSAEEAVANPDMGAYDVKDGSPIRITSAGGTNSPVGESSNEMDDSEQNGSEQGDGSALEECKDQEETISRLEDDDEHNEHERYCKSARRYLGNSCESARLTKHSKATDIIQQTRDMDLEDGTVDALEVARLVAQEVEREVGGYCEQSGSSASSSSSSDGKSSGSNRQLDIPKSINGEQDMQLDGLMNQMLATENTPEGSSKAPLIRLANTETNLQNHTQDGESSWVTEAAWERENNTSKSFWEFDLNQGFSSEDADHQVETTSSNPVSVVSASRAVVASGMPAGPLQFEGSLSWKGSAATSAFWPASPRRASDSDRALSGGGVSSGSRQRQDFLDIDLNVADGLDDKIVNPMLLDRKKQMLPSLPSGESSVEVSPKKYERLKLDLNQIEDDVGLLASEWKMGGQIFRSQNCQRSPSPASSSSCMQPFMRNFDLNDNPFNCSDSTDQPVFLGESSRKNLCMGSPDDAVISILGTKVKRNAFPPQTSLPFLNGRASEPMMDASLLRGGPLMGLGPAVPYPPGINGLGMSPAVSLASAQIYRPGGLMPYVFDSRGAPFIPQMLGSASAVLPSYGQPSLVMNMMGATPGANLSGPLRPNLDLNSGFAGNADSVFFRPLFIPHGQGRPSEEQLSIRDGFRPLSSGSGGGKRKEPDSGWDFYPTNYKHQQPPHL